MVTEKLSLASCSFCGKPLVVGEALLCASCVAFIEWKYGSLEAFQKKHDRAVGRPKP